MLGRRRACALLLGLAVSVASTSGFAQSHEDRATALALFAQGRELVTASNYGAAAIKFEAASKLLHTFGILLNLADCYEKLGRTASAWFTWRKARSVARAARREDDEARAIEHERLLEPKLAYLTLSVATPAPDALQLFRNGVLVPEAAWNGPLAVDAGAHQVVAKAPGFAAVELEVTIRDGERQSLTVPSLKPESALGRTPDGARAGLTPVAPRRLAVRGPASMEAAAPRSEMPAKDRVSSAWVGWSAAGTGVVATVVGALMWRGGQSKIDGAIEQARSAIVLEDRAAYDAAAGRLASGKAQRTAGGIVAGAGLVLGAGGAVLILVNTRARNERTARLGAWCLPGGLGVTWTARF